MSILISVNKVFKRLIGRVITFNLLLAPASSMASVVSDKMWISFNTTNFVQVNPSAGQPDVFGGEIVAPVRNVVKTHKLGVSYKLSPNLIISANLPYSDKSANIISTTYPDFQLLAKGLGDLNLSSNYTLFSKDNEKLQVDFALGLPTGSVTLKNDTPFGEDQLLPFSLQPGSGTYDIGFKTIYVNGEDTWSWGGQLSTLIRIGKNERDFSLGNRYEFNLWTSHELTTATTIVLGLSGIKFGDIEVMDPSSISTISRKFLAGGERLDLECALNFRLPEAILNYCSFNIKYSKPLYQKRDAPIEVSHNISAGIQLSF